MAGMLLLARRVPTPPAGRQLYGLTEEATERIMAARGVGATRRTAFAAPDR